MKLIALDIGTRRTGIAYSDDAKIPLALDTFHHTSEDELIAHVIHLVRERTIEKIVIGLPLLPSGEEGAQVEFVRGIGDKLSSLDCSVEYIDERYSTPTFRDSVSREVDPDSASACQILQVYCDRNTIIDN